MDRTMRMLCLLIFVGCLRSACTQTYLCNGQYTSYPNPACTYNTGFNSGFNTGYNSYYPYTNNYGYNSYPYSNYGYNSYPYSNYNNLNTIGNTGVQYLCNGQYTSYPNPACTYNTNTVFGKRK